LLGLVKNEFQTLDLPTASRMKEETWQNTLSREKELM